MANWYIVSPYGADDSEWLRGVGIDPPAVDDGNRGPATLEMLEALESVESLIVEVPEDDAELWAHGGEESLAVRGFQWDDRSDDVVNSFPIRGSGVIFDVLVKLSEKCGQLYFVGEGGEVPIVIDSSFYPDELAQLYREGEALDMADWPAFYDRLYHG